MLRCPECGTPYRQITRGSKRYCSERCRKRAEHKRWKAKHKKAERKAKKYAERIQAKEEARLAKEASKKLLWEEKAERLAQERRLRAERKRQNIEWRLKHRAEIRKLEQCRKKRILECRQRVAAEKRKKSRMAYREKQKLVTEKLLKNPGWILCKAVCKECGEEFEYAQHGIVNRNKQFCSPTCRYRWKWIHAGKKKFQAKMLKLKQLNKQNFQDNQWERVLNPNNSVDRIFIYGY